MVLAITIPELAAMLAYGPVGMFFTPDAPGRRCQPRVETAVQIINEARDYLRNNPPPDNASMIIV